MHVSIVLADLMLFGKILYSFFLGLIIGFEREIHRSPAGLRTYAAVCLGSCVFGLISTHSEGAAYYQSVVDPTRVAAQVVSGIGFLCAGVIFREGRKTSGLTTAATIWTAAAIGLAVAFEMYITATLSTFLIVLLLSLNHIKWWKEWKMRLQSTRHED